MAAGVFEFLAMVVGGFVLDMISFSVKPRWGGEGGVFAKHAQNLLRAQTRVHLHFLFVSPASTGDSLFIPKNSFTDYIKFAASVV